MTPHHSALARLQRTGVLLAWGLALWCLWWWRERPLVALAVVLALTTLHAWVLALEFVLMAWQNRRDPAPRAGWRLLKHRRLRLAGDGGPSAPRTPREYLDRDEEAQCFSRSLSS